METLEGTLGRLTEKLTDAGMFSLYKERSKKCTSLESKIAAAESVVRTITEATPIVKHNGAGDNGTLFTESAGSITEAGNSFSKADRVMHAAMGISEADQRSLQGLPPAGEQLTASQLREYRFLRSIRLSESDALKGARMVA